MPRQVWFLKRLLVIQFPFALFQPCCAGPSSVVTLVPTSMGTFRTGILHFRVHGSMDGWDLGVAKPRKLRKTLYGEFGVTEARGEDCRFHQISQSDALT